MSAVWSRVRGGATGQATAPGSHGHNLVSVKVLEAPRSRPTS